MKLSINTIKINYFETLSGLEHGSSPRYFKNELGEIEQYDFSGPYDLEKKTSHLIRFMKTFAIKNATPYLLNQVHSDRVYILKDTHPSREQVSAIEADAIMTGIPEIPIGVFTADCIPVLLYDPGHHVGAVVHAGRRGTCLGIVGETIAAMEREYGCRPESLVAGFGPGIGGCCYEVDEMCLLDFEKQMPIASSFVKPGQKGKFFLDLVAVNERECIRAGMRPENIFNCGECTYCSPMKYFSYRRENQKGRTGRILTFMMLRTR